ncbi:MAG: AEC family transporter, partial [Schaalia sp.]|nr:AEC family transporter [Schaalia sp.]
MASILWSVLSIALIIGVGWIARRAGALGSEAAGSLASVTYWVASPAMLFHAIVSTGTSGVFGPPLAVAAASGVGTALLFVALARLFLRLTRGETTLGAMASSLNNGAYIGIPIAVYVLGDASAVVPILVFQLGFFTPMFFVLADLAGSGRPPSVGGIVRVVARNPMVVAAACGFLFSV